MRILFENLFSNKIIDVIDIFYITVIHRFPHTQLTITVSPSSRFLYYM